MASSGVAPVCWPEIAAQSSVAKEPEKTNNNLPEEYGSDCLEAVRRLERLPRPAAVIVARRMRELENAIAIFEPRDRLQIGLLAKPRIRVDVRGRAVSTARAEISVAARRSLFGLWESKEGDWLTLALHFATVAVTPADRLLGEFMIAESYHFLGDQRRARVDTGISCAGPLASRIPRSGDEYCAGRS